MQARQRVHLAAQLMLAAAVMLLGVVVGSRIVWAGAENIRAAEKQRVETIAQVRPAVVAIYARGGQGGGSGVLIDKDGYALTNFHVVQGSGPIMQCGLADGILYDAVLVGLDKVGDVALIKLLPKTEGKPFPFVSMGDSDKVREGDWSLAMGNPFLLATDFTPTVTFGLISGVHRYQYPEGTLLEYTDCIQIDTSINPGNSGGPLFNMNGELIGINGRGSFDKRRRINSGVGYAISINQIKNFLGHLYGGIDTDHATLGARVESQSEEILRLSVKEVLDDADVARRGLEVADELIAFAGRPLTTVNEFKNVLGIYPKDWRLPLVFRHENQRKEVLVRLMGLQPKEVKDDGAAEPKPGPRPTGPARPPLPDGPAKKLYKAKDGFANYHFNELHQNRIWTAFAKHGDFTTLKGTWTCQGEIQLKSQTQSATLAIFDKKADNGNVSTHVKFDIAGVSTYELEPLKSAPNKDEVTSPPGSGGMLMAMYHLRRLLTEGIKGFERNPAYGGWEPFYPYPSNGATPKSLRDLRVDTEVLRTEHGGVPVKWFFDKKDQKLLGFEAYAEDKADPCEVYLAEFRPVDGKLLPHRIEVRYGNERFATFTVKNFNLATK